MADRRRAADERESDKQYLEKSGVNDVVKDLLVKLVSNRPDEPINFIADYFSSMSNASDRVDKAKRQLSMAPHSSPAFMINVRTAYEILSDIKGERSPAAASGMNGVLYERLLEAITGDLPENAKQKLLARIKCRGHEAVHFDVFQSGVFNVFALKDFLKHAADLHASLDVNKSGQVDRSLADVVLSQLQSSIVDPAGGGGGSDVLEGSYNLSPDRLALVLSQASPAKDIARTAISRDGFVNKAVDIFLLKVAVLR